MTITREEMQRQMRNGIEKNPEQQEAILKIMQEQEEQLIASLEEVKQSFEKEAQQKIRSNAELGSQAFLKKAQEIAEEYAARYVPVKQIEKIQDLNDFFGIPKEEAENLQRDVLLGQDAE